MKKLFKNMFLLSILALSTHIHAQDLQVKQTLSPSNAVALAQHELPNMLQLIEADQIKDYGFDLTDDFSQVQIGRPFYVVNLPRTSSLETINVNPYTIMLPVILNGSARCVLYVSQEEGQWNVVGIGEGHFVAEQQSLFSTITQHDGSSHVLVSVPHMNQLYLMENNHTFKPLYHMNDEDAMNPISMEELVTINNTIPAAANDGFSQDQLNDINEQPNQNK